MNLPPSWLPTAGPEQTTHCGLCGLGPDHVDEELKPYGAGAAHPTCIGAEHLPRRPEPTPAPTPWYHQPMPELRDAQLPFIWTKGHAAVQAAIFGAGSCAFQAGWIHGRVIWILFLAVLIPFFCGAPRTQPESGPTTEAGAVDEEQMPQPPDIGREGIWQTWRPLPAAAHLQHICEQSDCLYVGPPWIARSLSPALDDGMTDIAAAHTARTSHNGPTRAVSGQQPPPGTLFAFGCSRCGSVELYELSATGQLEPRELDSINPDPKPSLVLDPTGQTLNPENQERR